MNDLPAPETRKHICHEGGMVRRRTFLTGAATSSALLAAGVRPALAAGSRSILPVALVDYSLPAAATFTRRIREYGGRVEHFTGDISRLWRKLLLPRLQAAPVHLAGLTGSGALFCLERWAWDLGMRVVLRIDHVPQADGSWHHRSAADLPDSAIRHLENAGNDFASHAADIVIAGAPLQIDCTHAAAVHSADNMPSPTVSWVIAPTTNHQARGGIIL
ncbi:MAG: hypothetical protein ACK5NN_13080 [Sphingomonadaceae bacterium]